MLFRRTYELADRVEACLESGDSFLEINWDEPAVQALISKFSRLSLLHHYIFSMIAVTEREYFEQKDDLYEDDPSLFDQDAMLFEEYGIPFVPFRAFGAANEESESRRFLSWFRAQEQRSFFPLWEELTDEVFHILFGNRAFLMRFNMGLADWLDRNPHIGERTPEGRVNRSHIPRWVRKAVFYRDHGRCVLCLTDLSGLLVVDSEDHFDHMVPLRAGGVNDPSNIQLLCGDCNRRKAAGSPQTGSRYTPWWLADGD